MPVSVASMIKRPIWRRMLVICGLSAIAVTAPLLDLYGRNPEVFVANRTSPWEIVLFGLLVTLTVPLIAFGVLVVVGKVGEKAEDIAYTVMVVGLALAAGLVVGRQVFPDKTLGAVGIALLVTAGFLALHRSMRGLLVMFAAALPIVLVLFVSTSASARLVWSEPDAPSVASRIGDPAPIILIQLDEFPLASLMDEEGGINEALFPNFARLADEGTWYRNAFSNSIATTQSVPAILTGRLGEKGLSPSSVDHPNSVFTLLGDTYEMHVIEWVAEMCPEEICPEFAGRAPARFSSLLQDVGVVYGHLTLPPPARDRLPSIGNDWKGFLGQETASSGAAVAVDGLPVPPAPERAEWVDWMQRITNGIGDDASPIFHYAHLKSPHVPWVTNPSGTHYDRPEEYTEVEGVGGDGRWVLESEPAMLAFQRHLYQLGFLDAMFGRLFERLDETGTWDDTMIIVVADHGASFVPGEHRRWPYENNRDDLYRVPMFVKYPHQEAGMVRDEPAYGFDILPTIVEVLEISTDWEFDGISLLEITGTDRPHEPLRWCCSGDGASTDLDVLFGQVARNYSWIPNQGSWLEVAGVGRYAGLVGREVASLGVSDSDQVRWSLDAPLEVVDRSDGMVQTLVTGRVEIPSTVTSDDILVVINGKVAGVGFISRDSSGGGSIRSLLAEDLLVDGVNDVEVLVAAPDGGWLSGEVDVLTLEFVADDGHLLEIQAEGSRRLQVDDVTTTSEGWTIVGWAADVVRKKTPDTIYVFAGDILVAWGPPNADNNNVVRWFGSDDLLRSGFTFDVATDLVPGDLEQLTVVAEFGSYAIGDVASLGLGVGGG